MREKSHKRTWYN